MLDKTYFDLNINREGTDCFKWDYNKEIFGTDDLIPLWVADMDFRSPPEVMEALTKRTRHGIFGYSFHSNGYYNSIINWQRTMHDWQIKRDWIINTPGIVPGINIALQAFSQPGDRVVFLSPVYDPFLRSINNNKRTPINSDLIYTGKSYEIDFEDLEEKCKAAKILLFCSPHNPVGRVWTKVELEKIAEICLRNDVLIISDEIHSDLVYENYKHIPFAHLSSEISANTITFNAPSKTFNIAGLATSYAIIEKKELSKVYSNAIARLWLTSGNLFGMIALESAYREGQAWLKELLEYLQVNFNYLEEFFKINIPQIKPVETEGTYLAWLNCTELGMKQENLNDFMTKKAKVGLTDGEQYGAAGKGFMRLNFGCPRAILKSALDRIYQAVVNVN